MKPPAPRTRAPDAPPPPPIGDPPPKKIYHIVQPEALARVYAAAYASRADTDPTQAARAAVRDFVRLMREDLE